MLIFHTNAANVALSRIIAGADSGEGAAKLCLYSGEQPTADEAVGEGTLLAEITCQDPCGVVAGKSIILSLLPTRPLRSGMATFYRLMDSDNNVILQGPMSFFVSRAVDLIVRRVKITLVEGAIVPTESTPVGAAIGYVRLGGPKFTPQVADGVDTRVWAATMPYSVDESYRRFVPLSTTRAPDGSWIVGGQLLDQTFNESNYTWETRAGGSSIAKGYLICFDVDLNVKWEITLSSDYSVDVKASIIDDKVYASTVYHDGVKFHSTQYTFALADGALLSENNTTSGPYNHVSDGTAILGNSFEYLARVDESHNYIFQLTYRDPDYNSFCEFFDMYIHEGALYTGGNFYDYTDVSGGIAGSNPFAFVASLNPLNGNINWFKCFTSEVPTGAVTRYSYGINSVSFAANHLYTLETYTLPDGIDGLERDHIELHLTKFALDGSIVWSKAIYPNFQGFYSGSHYATDGSSPMAADDNNIYINIRNVLWILNHEGVIVEQRLLEFFDDQDYKFDFDYMHSQEGSLYLTSTGSSTRSKVSYHMLVDRVPDCLMLALPKVMEPNYYDYEGQALVVKDEIASHSNTDYPKTFTFDPTVAITGFGAQVDDWVSTSIPPTLSYAPRLIPSVYRDDPVRRAVTSTVNPAVHYLITIQTPTVAFDGDLHDRVSMQDGVFDASGNLYIAGHLPQDNALNQTYENFVAKFSPTGERLWAFQYVNQANQYRGETDYQAPTRKVFLTHDETKVGFINGFSATGVGYFSMTIIDASTGALERSIVNNYSALAGSGSYWSHIQPVGNAGAAYLLRYVAAATEIAYKADIADASYSYIRIADSEAGSVTDPIHSALGSDFISCIKLPNVDTRANGIFSRFNNLLEAQWVKHFRLLDDPDFYLKNIKIVVEGSYIFVLGRRLKEFTNGRARYSDDIVITKWTTSGSLVWSKKYRSSPLAGEVTLNMETPIDLFYHNGKLFMTMMCHVRSLTGLEDLGEGVATIDATTGDPIWAMVHAPRRREYAEQDGGVGNPKIVHVDGQENIHIFSNAFYMIFPTGVGTRFATQLTPYNEGQSPYYTFSGGVYHFELVLVASDCPMLVEDYAISPTTYAGTRSSTYGPNTTTNYDAARAFPEVYEFIRHEWD